MASRSRVFHTTEDTVQIGPKRDIRFRACPLATPGMTIYLWLKPDMYGVVVKVRLLGEDGWNLGTIIGRFRGDGHAETLSVQSARECIEDLE